MARLICLCFALLAAYPAWAATFGSVVPLLGGAADIVLDEPRQRLYLVNTTSRRIEVYSTSQRRFLPAIVTDAAPFSAAMSRSGRFLYVACTDASTLNIIDLNPATPVVTGRISLPARPEGVAVGVDERVLVTTIGTGQGRFTLLTFDPSAAAGNQVQEVFIAPPAPGLPQLPPPSGRIFLSARSRLLATRDGRFIIGVNGLANNAQRVVFVYEVSSATVLRSRVVTNLSNVLSISPDGSKFMSGITLFDTATLAVLAQQNVANQPFSTAGGNANNFNLQQNQGGSIFSPDGRTVYSAFNIAPVQNPPARANVTRFLVNDPDNLLTTLGLQMPENLAGGMAITADGGTIYALSESGFVIIPIGQANDNPIALPERTVVMLARDQCGVTANLAQVAVPVRNAGRGARMTVSAQLLQLPNTGVGGLGGVGGPGGGVGGNIQIVLPPVIPGIGNIAGIPGIGGIAGGNQAAAITQTSPQVQVQNTGNAANMVLRFNPNAARSLGTIAPHEILLQSNEAINIPPNVRVFQNNREAEARGTLLPVETNSTSEGLVDMLVDNTRNRIYIANSSMNRVEVFDMRTQRFLNPIKVGQLPRALAFGTDGVLMYVANFGSEYLSVVDLDRGVQTSRIAMPPLPFNVGFAVVTPTVMASSQRGPQLIMSDGTVWRVSGNELIPRTLPTGVFGGARTIAGPVRTMASTPGGEFVLLLAGNGTAYLYDAGVDEFVVARTVVPAPIQGYYGAVAAGPRGSYYLVNNIILNSSLTPIGTSPSITVTPGPGGGQVIGGLDPGALPGPLPTQGLPNRGGTTTLSRPISAVSAGGNTTFARFSQPVRLNANAAVTDPGLIEIVDINTLQTVRTASSLEGPLQSGTGNQRINISGRLLAVDQQLNTAYALTSTGLSVIPLQPVANADRPVINPNGVVHGASYLPTMAPGQLVSIFGRNLARQENSTPNLTLPTILGGACVTLNNVPLPLVLAGPGQINAQIPPTLAAGRHALVVRSLDRQIASQTTQVTVQRYAPAVFVDAAGQPAILHRDGSYVTPENPARRDEQLVMYATGLGVTKGGRVTAGEPAPSNPLAVTDKVQVFFGNPGYREAEMIVEWSGLVPGQIGIYQINLRVPGDRIRGKQLPVQLRIGGVFSPSRGPAIPTVAVE